MHYIEGNLKWQSTLAFPSHSSKGPQERNTSRKGKYSRRKHIQGRPIPQYNQSHQQSAPSPIQPDQVHHGSRLTYHARQPTNSHPTSSPFSCCPCHSIMGPRSQRMVWNSRSGGWAIPAISTPASRRPTSSPFRPFRRCPYHSIMGPRIQRMVADSRSGRWAKPASRCSCHSIMGPRIRRMVADSRSGRWAKPASRCSRHSIMGPRIQYMVTDSRMGSWATPAIWTREGGRVGSGKLRVSD